MSNITKEVSAVSAKKGGIWSYIWLPTAILLALSAGGLTGGFRIVLSK